MSGQATKTTPRADSTDTRTRILQSAVAVMRERGYPGTRIAHISKHAEVSDGLVIYYYKTRDQLLSAALRYADEQFQAAANKLLDAIPNAGERLCKLLVLAFQPEGDSLVPTSWLLWPDIWQQAMRNPEIRRTREELDLLWRNVMADIVREGQASGQFAAVDPDDFARMLSALLDGLAIALLLRDSRLTGDQALAISLRLCEHELGKNWRLSS